MTDRDDDPPNNVIPFGHVVPYAIAEQLRQMYAAFVEEELPPGILALMQQFEDQTKEEKQQQPIADTAAAQAEQSQMVAQITASAEITSAEITSAEITASALPQTSAEADAPG